MSDGTPSLLPEEFDIASAEEAPSAPAVPSAGAYIGLARRFRPQLFSELTGQDQIAHSLSQQVMQNKVAQAYIFSGPRGVGKTSAARILAKSLNCRLGATATPCGTCEQCVSITTGNSMDVIEIDGASNRGIEDIRHLQESINQNPFAARKKIYIIDEVHMLTREAFNALLKTLEEPPPFVIFIFATTELEKIPETIKSRCQMFQFNRISMEDLIRRLDYVAAQENIQMDPGERRAILETIALAVDGGMRDALMSIDQLRALGDGSIRLDETVRFLGVVEHDLLIRTVELLQSRDTKALLEMVNYLVDRGRDLERYVKNLLSFLRDLMILKSGGGKELVNLTGEKLERTQALLWTDATRRDELLSYPTLLNYLQVFLNLEEQIKEAVQVRIHLEFAFVKLTAIEPVIDIAQLLDTLDKSGGTGAALVAPAPAPGTPPPPPPAPTSRSASPAATPAAPASNVPDLFGGAKTQAAAPPAQQPQQAAAPAKTMDPAAMWEAVLAHREKLGMGLSLALKDCRYLGGGEDFVRVGIPRRSMQLAMIQTPERRASIETLLTQIAGRKVKFDLQVMADVPAQPSQPTLFSAPDEKKSAPASPSTASSRLQPVLREEHIPESSDEYAEMGPTDTHALFLSQNPEARVRSALQNNSELRDQVEMIRRFFDGRILDGGGHEILL